MGCGRSGQDQTSVAPLLPKHTGTSLTSGNVFKFFKVEETKLHKLNAKKLTVVCFLPILIVYNNVTRALKDESERASLKKRFKKKIAFITERTCDQGPSFF